MTSEPRTTRVRLGHPIVVTALAGIVALIASALLVGDDIGLAGYLLALLAGILLGAAAAAGIRRLAPPWISWLVHVAGAVALGVALWIGIETGWPTDAPPPIVRIVLAAKLAGPPAAAWVWLALLARIGELLDAGTARRTAAATAPEWHRDADGWRLRAPGVVVASSTVTAVTVGVALVFGGAVLATVLFVGSLVERLGPTLLIVGLGWLVLLPIGAVLHAVVSRRTVATELRIHRGRLQLATSNDGLRVLVDTPLDGAADLRWAPDEYPARWSIRPTGEPGTTVLVGWARVPKGTLARLPALPPRLLRELVDAGIDPSPRRRRRSRPDRSSRREAPARRP